MDKIMIFLLGIVFGFLIGVSIGWNKEPEKKVEIKLPNFEMRSK